MPSLWARWQSAWTASHPASHDPDPILQAGREGEEHLEKALRALPGKASVFNVFVGSDPKQNNGGNGGGKGGKNGGGNNNKKDGDMSRKPRGKKEIDAVILTPEHLYVIEVKNYGGQLSVSSDFHTCTQITSRKETRTMDNPVVSNREKADVLTAHMLQRKINFPDNFIRTRVCFVNKNLKLTSNELSSHADVITAEMIPDFLKQISKEYGKQKVLVETANRGKTYTADLLSALRQLPTWDTIHLVGGEIMSGICAGIRIEGNKELIRFKRPKEGSHEVKMHHNRSLFLQGFMATFGRDPSVKVAEPTAKSFSVPISKASVVFRPVGQTHEQEMPANEVTMIEVSALSGM